jgi:hypothetical protein
MAAFAKWPLLIPARAQRARFFDDARGSALECAACLDASVADSEHVHEEPFLNGLPTGEWASVVTKTASRVNSPAMAAASRLFNPSSYVFTTARIFWVVCGSATSFCRA